MREHRGIVKMGVHVEAAERETVRGVEKFAPGTVAGHPADLQGFIGRKIQGALHGYGDGATGGEDGDAFAWCSGGEEFGEAGIYAGAEIKPGLDIRRSELAADPFGDYRFEEFLEGGALGLAVGGGTEGGVESADVLIGFE